MERNVEEVETTLYEHIEHPHMPANVNLVHEIEISIAGFNTKLAIDLTELVGTMWTAYAFASLAVIGLLAILGIFPPLIALLVAWVSQTFLQLVFLPILSVGQNVLGRKQELQSNELYDTTQHMFHDLQQMIIHLDKQDQELLKQTQLLLALSQRILENKDAG